MKNVVVFREQTYSQAIALIDFLALNVVEYEIEQFNCVNGRDGDFKKLRIFEKRAGSHREGFIAEVDTRYPGMINVFNDKVLEYLIKVLEDYIYPVLILDKSKE